ncbi:MAG: hypothetical protein R3A51_18505 [Nannocystaceae bacterium]|nr:hypothetical protein [Myxococcales bacterium]
MRLEILDQGRGHSSLQKLQFRLIRRILTYVPEPIYVMSYRRAWFGKYFAAWLQRSMRKAKHWSKAETELFAAFTAHKTNCAY